MDPLCPRADRPTRGPPRSSSPEGTFSPFLCPPQLAALSVTAPKPPEPRSWGSCPSSLSSQTCWQSCAERGSQPPPPKALGLYLIHSPPAVASFAWATLGSSLMPPLPGASPASVGKTWGWGSQSGPGSSLACPARGRELCSLSSLSSCPSAHSGDGLWCQAHLEAQAKLLTISEHPSGTSECGLWNLSPQLGKLSPHKRKLRGYILRQDGRRDPYSLPQPWHLTPVGPGAGDDGIPTIAGME